MINAANTRSTPGQSRAFAGTCRSSTSPRTCPRTRIVAPLKVTSTTSAFDTSTTRTPSRPSRSTTRARSTHGTPGATVNDTSLAVISNMASVVSISGDVLPRAGARTKLQEIDTSPACDFS